MGSIAGFQAVQVVAGTVLLTSLGRGSVPSLVAGALVMLTSMILQRFALRAALKRDRQPAVAILFLAMKLTLVLVLVYVGFQTVLLGPMSFAAGATTLPVAIVLDVCYHDWSSRRPGATFS